MPEAFKLTESAILDLEQAVAYVSSENETSAMKLADTLEHAFRFIAQWPDCGHRRTDLTLEPDVRVWSTSGYLIVYYRNLHQPILILGVLHGARDAALLLPSRLGDQ